MIYYPPLLLYSIWISNLRLMLAVADRSLSMMDYRPRRRVVVPYLRIVK